jgi:hypothetical protein
MAPRRPANQIARRYLVAARLFGRSSGRSPPSPPGPSTPTGPAMKPARSATLQLKQPARSRSQRSLHSLELRRRSQESAAQRPGLAPLRIGLTKETGDHGQKLARPLKLDGAFELRPRLSLMHPQTGVRDATHGHGAKEPTAWRRVAAISTSEGATPICRTCRTVTTTTTAIAVHARHSRATPHARLRLGRIASADEVRASDGGTTAPDASSADFTALEN